MYQSGKKAVQYVGVYSSSKQILQQTVAQNQQQFAVGTFINNAGIVENFKEVVDPIQNLRGTHLYNKLYSTFFLLQQLVSVT